MGKLIRLINSIEDYPITLCGSAWKGSYKMYQAFRSDLLQKYPKANIIWPIFDAVVGGLIHCALRGGMDRNMIIERLMRSCSGWIYKKPADWRD